MGPILDYTGDQIMAEIELSKDAKVSSIIRNGNWRWPWAASEDLMAIKQIILALPPPVNQEPDKVIWEPDKNGNFSIKSVYGKPLELRVKK